MRLFVALLISACLAFSQGNTSTILGTVTDPSGAVVPATRMVVTNTRTGVQFTAETDGSGNYRAPYLLPGTYRIEAQAAGFKRFVRDTVALEMARELRIDVALEAGQVSETVNVTAEAPLVQTETGSLGTTVQNEQVRNLPLAGRNPQNLKNIVPGVVRNRDGDLVTSGGMVRKDPYYIDGAHSSNHVWSGTPVNPNPDVVDEVRVLTNSFSAEYGQSSGSVMLATTRSGSNEVHGSLFEFFRNDKLNGGNYYTHQRPIQRFNQFGGTVGGPIVRNRTFFFGGIQATRERGTTVFPNYTLPLDAFRRGDFSSVLGAQVGTDVLGRPVFRNQIFDPTTTRTVQNASGANVVVRDPFPGNVIPASRLSPAALKLQALFPQPQTNAVAANYSAAAGNSSNATAIDLRVDHNFSDADRITGRYSRNGSESSTPLLFGAGGIGGGGTSFGSGVTNTGQQAVLNHVHVFGSRTTNSLHLAYFRTFPHRYTAGYGETSMNDYGIFGLPNGAEKLGTPRIEFNGTGAFAALGSPSGSLLLEKQESFSLVNLTSLVRGSHTIKLGGEVRRLRTDNIQPQPDNGLFSFNNLFTDQRGFNNTGYDYASFLLGSPSNFQYEIYPGYISPRGSVYAVFAQDDIRVNRRLTVNIGLRWDAPLYFSERMNRSGIFNLDQRRFVQFGTEGFRTSVYEQDWNNFGPRFGFAFTPFNDNRTVVRGGYGMFTLSQQGFGQSGGLPRQPIFADADAGRYSSTDQINPRTTLDRIPYEPASKVGTNALAVSIYPDRNPIGYFQQWNLNVARQFGSYLFEVGYAGSRGTHLPFGAYNLNAIPANQISTAAGRLTAPFIRYPEFPNGVTVQSSIGSSSYNSLQLKAERRFSSGLSFLAAYTWQKTMTVGDLAYRAPLDNRNLDRGVDPNSVPHRFTVAYTYHLPFGKGRPFLTSGVLSQVIGGWEINGITTLQSGFPLTPSSSVNTCQCGATSRPNVVGDPQLPSDQRTTERYFNVEAFQLAPQFTIGNAGRALLYGPGLVNFDIGVQKRFFLPMLPEGSNLEVRGEAYNATNTPFFDIPNMNIGQQTAGRITSVLSSARAVQLALKLTF